MRLKKGMKIFLITTIILLIIFITTISFLFLFKHGKKETPPAPEEPLTKTEEVMKSENAWNEKYSEYYHSIDYAI